MDSSSRATDPLLYIERQARQLQQDIQRYLDAQSEGLLTGLSGEAPADDVASNGSRTPTQSTTSRRREPTIPVRQPPKRKIGLRGARRGITRSMQYFQQLREEELGILQSQLQERDIALGRVDEFARKREGLEKEIGGLRDHEDSQRVQTLKSKAKDTEKEIAQLEMKLGELRSRHRHLTAEASKLENSVQARLSSYENSLSLLDSEEQTFLRKPPIQLPLRSYDHSTFSAIRNARRTLSMANDHWKGEEDEINRRREEVELEREALRDGAGVWKNVVEDITAFETLLRDEMHRLGKQKADQDDAGLKTILKHMDHTLEHLQGQYNLAEERDWKLLVVAIGAELEAFKCGREVLREAAGISEPSLIAPDDNHADQPFPDGDTEQSPFFDGSSHDDTESAKSEPSRAADPSHEPSHDAFTDEENDEPDPDLLISH